MRLVKIFDWLWLSQLGREWLCGWECVFRRIQVRRGIRSAFAVVGTTAQLPRLASALAIAYRVLPMVRFWHNDPDDCLLLRDCPTDEEVALLHPL
jgi:hypothetical protein